MNKHNFKVFWSEEDNEYVCTCDKFESFSWLDSSPVKALEGMVNLIEDIKEIND